MNPVSGQNDSHSRIVFWLKIVLPMLALALLSTIFLVSRNIGGDGTIPFSDVDLDAMARDQRLGAPEYSGTTTAGDALRITGQSVTPTTDGATAVGVAADWNRNGTQRISLVAAGLALDQTAGRVTFTGDVVLTTSNGYTIRSQELRALLDRTEIESPGPVTAKAPYGQLDAGSMRYAPGRDQAANEVLVFNKGVRLIYDPKN